MFSSIVNQKLKVISKKQKKNFFLLHSVIKTITRAPQSVTHTIVVKKDKDGKRQRKACKRCYARISKESGSAVAERS